jgi:PAS domain S-box-containing protein
MQNEKVLARISDSFVALDTNWVYTYVNEKAAQMFGRTPEQLIGKHIWTEFPEGIGQPFYHAYYKAAETQQPIFLEEYYPPYDRWFENRIYPSKDGLSIFFSDITDRKKAEQSTRETQERLTLAIRSANVGLWDWDIHTNQVHFSPEWKKQLGYEDHELSDEFSEWENRLHPDDLERAKANARAFLEKPSQNFQNEFRMRHKDGSYRWILAQASMIQDDQGQAVRLIGSHIDITEHKLAEEQFRYQATLLTNISDAIIATNMEFKIKHWNAAAQQMYGWTEAEVIERVFSDLIQNEYINGTREGMLRATLDNGSWSGEVVQNRKDGTKIPVLVTVSLVKDAQGTPIGLIAINRDITERKKADNLIAGEKRILEMIARADPLPKILDGIARNIESQSNGLYCTILLMDADGVHVRHGAAPSLDETYIRAIDGQPIGPKAGSCGTAAYRKEPVYVADIATDPLWADYREIALAHGLRACWSTPIKTSDGSVLGTFAMYYKEPRSPGPDDLHLIELATNLAGIAIEQKRAEENLRENEERFRLLVETSPYGIGVVQNGHVAFANPAAARLFGARDVEELVGAPIQNLIHPEAWEDVRERIERMLHGERVQYPREERYMRLDGSAFPVEVIAVPFRYQGRPAIQVIVQDISERKRAQERVEASEKGLSLIFDTVSDVIFLLAVEPEDCFRFESINPTFLKVTGLRNEQVVGKRIEEVLPETAHALVINRYKQAIRENKPIHWEEVSAYPTGTLYGTVTITPYLNADGVCTHLVGAVHDITEIKRAEIEIQKLNQELEDRVTERTAQLLAANKELESFSYSVSHDLRAPLRAISGFSSILARRHRKDLNEEGQHYMDNIVQASARMGYLIDDLLIYSRLGREGVRRVPVSLANLMADLKRNMQSRLDEIQAEVDIADGFPTIIGDQTLLNQVFTNLLENAITYHKPDVPPKVTVDWQIEDDQVVIRVSDNGIGIAVENHEKIFNMFQRLHSDDEYPGTGIGLANVKKCLNLLGGHVTVASSVGQGTTFSIYLPKE